MKLILCASFLLSCIVTTAQRTDVPTVINQSKGSSFTTTDDLRNYSGRMDKSYVFRIAGQRGVQDYVWDSTDTKTPDDNVLTIVGAGKRFKLRFTGPIDASWYGANANAQDNSKYLQAALTAATSSVTKKVLVSNGKYFLLSNVTVPAGVTLEIGPGGLLTGNATITGGIIEGDFRQQLFTTGITVHPDACATGMFSMRWYGANGEADDYASLQKCFDVCTYQNKIKHIWWPNGTYQISKGLLFERDDNGDGKREFPTGYIIEGENKAYGGTGEVTLVCKNGNSFGINFQRVKGLVVRNIMAIGQNEELSHLSAADVMENPNTNWDNGNRTNSQSPHVAFSIDAIGTSATASANRYPDFVSKYTDEARGGSTDVTFEHCGARYWIVGFGISLAGTVQNGDKVSFNYCWSDNNKYAFANGNSQNRSNKLYQCGIWGQTYVAFDCQTFGENIGNPQEIEETNIAGYVRFLCRLNSWFSNGMTINNSHFELLGSLGGNFKEDAGILTINNTFANLAGDVAAGDGAIHHPVTIFRGESLTLTNSTLTYYTAGVGPMSFCAKYALFDNTRLDILPINTQGIGQTTFRHCKTGLFPFGDGDKITWTSPFTIANQYPYFTTDMEYIPAIAARNNYGSLVRKKINRTMSNKGYGLKDAQLIYIGKQSIGNVQDPDNTKAGALGITHVEFKLAPGSDEFKMIQPNDNVLTQGTDEFGRLNVMHQFGTVVSKNETSGIVVVKDIPRGVTAKGYDLWLFRPHVLIPTFAMGNISKGSTSISQVMIEGDVKQFPVHIPLNSPFFPEGTMILSYDPNSSTIVTSNPASITKKNIDILSSDWQTVEYGYADPMLVDKIGYKSGDLIYNIRKDLYPDVLFWVCNTSGITNSSVPPTFSPIMVTASLQGSQSIRDASSTVINDNSGTVYVDPPVPQTKLAITLPANPADGQEVRILFGGNLTSGSIVSALSINPNAGQAIIQAAPASKANAGECFIYQYKTGIKKWYRIQ